MRSLEQIVRANKESAARELADAGLGPEPEESELVESNERKAERRRLWLKHKSESKVRYWRSRRA